MLVASLKHRGVRCVLQGRADEGPECAEGAHDLLDPLARDVEPVGLAELVKESVDSLRTANRPDVIAHRGYRSA